MRACSGVWVAHGSGSADRETADAQGRLQVPAGRGVLRPAARVAHPGGGEGLLLRLLQRGPLAAVPHRPHAPALPRRGLAALPGGQPEVRRGGLRGGGLRRSHHPRPGLPLRAAAPDDPRAAAPRDGHHVLAHPLAQLRAVRDLPLARASSSTGLLGSSILGFHTQFHCNNFLDAVDRFLESRIDREQNAVVHQGQRTLVRPYPISIEWPSGWLRTAPPVGRVPASVFAELGLAAGRAPRRRRRPSRLHEGHRGAPPGRGAAARAAPGAPRTLHLRPARRAEPGGHPRVPLAQRGRRATSPRASTSASARASYRPVILQRAHHEPPTVFRYYRAADVCYVSSLHDGMNLVAKEFVAARDDEQGVLVLSHFTGAARELTEALIVNPYDLEEASAALARGARHAGGRAARPDAGDARARRRVQRLPLGRPDARGRGPAAATGAADGPLPPQLGAAIEAPA